MKLSSLSVFFPAYNEQENISELVNQALKVLPKYADKFEIIIVNDGSTDKTGAIARKLAKAHSVVYSYNHKNLGYGGAVKKGFARTRYEWIFFTDADLQFNLKEIRKMVSKTKKHQLVLGYRKNRAEGWKRVVLAEALKIWNSFLLGFPKDIKDIDCAFKLMHRDVLKSFSPLVSNGAMVTTEFLLKAYREGFSYTQVGVKHYPRKYGEPSGNNIFVILKAVRDTFILQWLLVIKPALKELW